MTCTGYHTCVSHYRYTQGTGICDFMYVFYLYLL
jgi:hypothetical protein